LCPFLVCPKVGVHSTRLSHRNVATQAVPFGPPSVQNSQSLYISPGSPHRSLTFGRYADRA
jgi:hypothetical protein